ncbi:putative reponse regulator (CheY and GGDEF domain family protein) [Desulforapulum autotrophicum HRM2]|uniref:diguanylate cyclase n=1 Tax=Desulforapulum autotrophicum (strain ATCC 43914 / DSM 3382 / VKM B-1955 / HRM2) TaxID=177437 RepID=C0Q9U5_DESAH|nr:sensor domain-containing diguanylate cyclase [Desulforapulum autotrophicum]ACN16663.1 putative reponse regulator (CheY and GGDEF domain family protein) [Desulforapulum autotrophicum HRM2]
MKIPDAILARLAANEQVAKKFHHIEISVLTILNFQDFFEQLLTKVGQTFQIPHVWISIIQESAIADQILAMEDSAVLKSSTSFITHSTFLRLIGSYRQPLLANQNLDRFSPLVPPEAHYDIGSIAIAPLFIDGELIGSLNQADQVCDRFMPGIDTDLLARLSLKISLCLSNVAAHEKLRHLAFHDPLTGLLNRRVMETILEREFERAKRYCTPLSVVFLDLDHFKRINDTFGHDQGDRALVCFAQSLGAAKRANDIVARFAGDEFVVILPSTTRQETDSYLARLNALLAQQPVKVNQSCFQINFSWGVASISDLGINRSADLLRHADQQLYVTKKNKKTLSG